MSRHGGRLLADALAATANARGCAGIDAELLVAGATLVAPLFCAGIGQA